MTTPDAALGAAFVQIRQLGERTALLDDREARNFRHTQTTLAGISAAITGLSDSAGRLAGQVAALAPPGEGPARGYTPRPAVQWWTVTGRERDKAVVRLAAFVDQVWRPFYGHFGAMLGACWQEHPLCLVQLDWLAEFHSMLYFPGDRTASLLTAQAEFATRIVPAVAEQFQRETSRCRHRRPAPGASPWAGTR